MQTLANLAKSAIFGVILTLLASGVGCSTASKPQQTPDGAGPPGATSVGPDQTIGPPLPPAVHAGEPDSSLLPAEPTSTSQYGPERPRSSAIVLVLGPGLARAYAAVGVIHALHDAKIPIAGIVGTEMGALIGALYATSRTINEFDWKILKLKEDSIRNTGLGLGQIFQKRDNGSTLIETLEGLFAKAQVEDAKIPIRIGLQCEGAQTPVVVREGGLVAALRSAMSNPSWLSASDIKGEVCHSTAPNNPFLVDEARAMALGGVVVLDVLTVQAPFLSGSGSKAERQYGLDMQESQVKSKPVLDQADLVIRPKISDVPYFDFKKKTLTEYRGKQAVQLQMATLKKLASQGGAP